MLSGYESDERIKIDPFSIAPGGSDSNWGYQFQV